MRDRPPLHVPPGVHDQLRRGRKVEAIKTLVDANPGVGLRQAKTAVEALASAGGGEISSDRPSTGARPVGEATLPSEVAARIATGNTEDAARRLRELDPALDEDAARRTVSRHASPLLREARQETVAPGDSGRYGWLVWVVLLVALAVGLAIWLG
ncbi:hypothetical protein [Luteimonas sp. FCS-9]|uniref:hypothetical protein n=1 Tax=Luteimonas sp. FCS-9 TaxID=1547516 RepID=UPI00063EB885|nr:hypothetical protein [Luteimonas sp. FCS-9]KLJ00981.1 hypothetical protein WQ56_06970 [Luteimonas sp. FCS-9]